MVAVLLENFCDATREVHRECQDAQFADNFLVNALDPMLEVLCRFENSNELSAHIQALFRSLDADDSGELSAEEMTKGVRRLNLSPPIRMTEEDFDALLSCLAIEEGREGKREGSASARATMLTANDFEVVMRAQIRDFVCRHLGHAVYKTGSFAHDNFALLFAGMHQLLMDSQLEGADGERQDATTGSRRVCDKLIMLENRLEQVRLEKVGA